VEKSLEKTLIPEKIRGNYRKKRYRKKSWHKRAWSSFSNETNWL